MEPIVDALAAQQAELAGLVTDLTEADWERPSRCSGWTVADVLLHLAQTDEMAIASAEGRFGDALAAMAAGAGPASSIDEGADVMVAHERGEPGEAVRHRWRAGADRLCEVLRATDPHARLTWVAGELSARTLATTRIAETWIHTGDVAAAFGVTLESTDRLRHIARLAWRTLPYAFARDGRSLQGPVAFELRGPGGDEWRFDTDAPAVTVVRGEAVELCLVAARRLTPPETTLDASGPDAVAVLELVRTYA